MKKIKYQTIKVTQSTSVSQVYTETDADLEKDYDICTGIAVVKNAGTGTNILIGIEDQNKRFFNKVPVVAWEVSPNYIDKDLLFLPCHIPARGNNINVLLDAATVTVALNYDIIFRLEKSEDIKKPEFEYQWQHKQLTIPSLTTSTTIYQPTEFSLDSSYDECIGVIIKSENTARIGINSQSGDVLLDQIINSLLYNNNQVPYIKRFYPVNIQARGKYIKLVYSPYATLGSTETVDCIFLLRKKIA